MMKKINSFIHPWIFLFVVCMLTFQSCSDKDVNETEEVDPNDPFHKESVEAVSLMNILHATTALDSLPNDWQENNFTVEPTIGKALEEANPYVRSSAVGSVEGAINFFNSITMGNLSSDATSGSWSKEGIGTLNLNVVNKDGVYATLDVHVKQLPHLTQIRFVDKNLLGENDGGTESYYQMGDVVSTQENGQTIYWTCVRNCNYKADKKKTHWVSFQLTKDNLKTFEASTTTAKMVVPTKLCSSADEGETILNAAKLFTLLVSPDAYEEDAYKSGLGEFGKILYPTSYVYRLARQWQEKDLFNKVFSKDINYQQFFDSERVLTTKDSINFYYYGYSKVRNMSLYGKTVQVNQSNKFNCVQSNDSWKPDANAFDISTFVDAGKKQWNQIANDPVGRVKKQALVIRCKTGKELCGKGDWRGNDPDNTKPFPSNAPTKVTEVFHYDKNAAYEYCLGDIVKDSEGAIWTCVLSPCNGNTKTIFMSTDNLLEAYKGAMPGIDRKNDFSLTNLMELYPWLYYYYTKQNDELYKDSWSVTTDKTLGAIPLDFYLQPIRHIDPKTNKIDASGIRTTFLTGSGGDLTRMYATHSQNKKYINCHAIDPDYKESYNLKQISEWQKYLSETKADSLGKYFFTYYQASPAYRTKTDKLEPKDCVIDRTNYENMAIRDICYFLFQDPIAFVRVRVLEPGDKTDFVIFKNSPARYIDMLKADMAKFFTTIGVYYELNYEEYEPMLPDD